MVTFVSHIHLCVPSSVFIHHLRNKPKSVGITGSDSSSAKSLAIGVSRVLELIDWLIRYFSNVTKCDQF